VKPRQRAAGKWTAADLFSIILNYLFISLIALAGLSCGKVGAPVPPTRLSARTSQLEAVQRGAVILLSWPSPPLGGDESNTSYVNGVEIFRLSERRSEEPLLDTEDYQESAQVIGYLDRAAIEALAKSGGRLQFKDALNLAQAGDLSNVRLRYAVRYQNKRGQTAAFSNTVAVEPAPGVALPPAELRASADSQDEVSIAWGAPDANADGTRPASVVGYNIYRRPARRESFREPLNSEPIEGLSYIDRNFQYQTDYVYAVRAVSQGASGLIESADSEPVSFTPLDRFPPAVPDPLSAASAGGVISLFWPSSPERDVIGYNVYRAESADSEKEWVKLNEQPVTTVTFRDDRVVIGKRYFYKVTAVDRFTNQSEPSRVVSESANP
jgi:hypothetical protein